MPLATGSEFPSLPVISPLGGTKQGQNRDNFFASSPARRGATQIAIWLVLALIGASVNPLDPGDDPLPRAPRKRHRAPEDQGLPADEELQKLATFYLTHAAKLWPEHVKDGLLAKPSKKAVADKVADFKVRHRTGQVDLELLERYLRRGLRLAAEYPRFSDDNSDPKSIPDQVRQSLDRAKQDGRFIPWELIVADYARSATHGHRQGFENLLKLIRNPEVKIEAVYIDDFQRGSRNDRDWWRLASICKRSEVRLVGVSDGFHLDDEDWDFKVRFYNIFSQMETRYKRQRVRRGMRGSAHENYTLGKLPLGFTRRVKRDANGQVERKPNGLAKTERCIDPATKDAALEMWRLFYVEKWTPHLIMKKFNDERVEDWDGWNESTIREALINPAYFGLWIWNRTRSEFNWDTGRMEIVNNPWQEWVWRYIPELALIPKSWHVYARSKLVKERKRRGRKKPQRCPVTLFSGTLVCGYCGEELKLNRSAGRHKSMACMDGIHSRRGCKLTCSKSVPIIEKSLLGYVKEHLLTEARLADLVTACNEQLAKEAKRPKADASAMNRRQRLLEGDVSRLLKRVARTDDEALCQAYEDEIGKLQVELNAVRRAVSKIELDNRPVPPALDLGRVKGYVADLRAILEGEIPAANEALRLLMGPVTITQVLYTDGRPGAQWFAAFTPNILGLLGATSIRLDYPDSSALEFLSASNWIVDQEVTMLVDRELKYRQLAPKFKELCDQGWSVARIADAHGMCWKQANDILVYALHGKRTWVKKSAVKRADEA